MNNQSWEDQVKAINAQHRYERLLIISKDLYKLIFDYTYKDYKWTCNEYNEMFKKLNTLAREYDGRDWKGSELLPGHYKTAPVFEKANQEWKSIQNGTAYA